MKYGLIGEKLGHSFSKGIHEQLATYTYELHPLSKEAFPKFMEEKAFCAINVTIPYKKDVLPYCILDEKAKKIGAVNAIVHKEGNLYGTNTDYDGFLYTLRKHQISVRGKKVLILGDGGAAQAIKAVLRDEGANPLISVRRHPMDASISYVEARNKHSDAQILINTSPSGMYPNLMQAPAELDDFPACEALIDIIYNPLRTSLCLQAKAKGIPYAGGLEMLIAQAKAAVEIFTQQAIPETRIDEIYRNLLKEKCNVVLIGMPSCGKSTIGRALAKKLHKTFVDLDEEIEQRNKRTIKAIIQEDGEPAFRKMEEEIIAQYSVKNNYVIATGGGAIKSEQNRMRLAMNGIVFYVKRDLDALLVDEARPLSSSKEAIQRLYEERKTLYEHMADETLDNNTSLSEVLNQAMVAYEKAIENA